MALARRIHVTFFTPLRVADRVKTEIDRNFDASEVEKRKLIRYVVEADLSVFHLCDLTLAYYSVVRVEYHNARARDRGRQRGEWV